MSGYKGRSPAVKADDDIYQALDNGIAIWGVRNDSLGTTFATTDQAYNPIATTEKGAIHVEPSASIKGPSTPTIDSYTSVAISAAAATADQALVAAPGSNKQIWVYGLVGTADTGDGSVSFQDEDNAVLSGVMPVAENGGFAINPSGNFSMPWIKVATNKALEVDTLTCGFKGILTYAIVSV